VERSVWGEKRETGIVLNWERRKRNDDATSKTRLRTKQRLWIQLTVNRMSMIDLFGDRQNNVRRVDGKH
jgi:hypothetical protein